METVDRENVSHALCATMGFFGKKIDGQAERIWFSALRGHEPTEIIRALADYTKAGKYSPKPVDILELLSSNKRKIEANESKNYTPCPENIRKAWLWFLKLSTANTSMAGMLKGGADIDPETQEHYLRTVNEQAKIYDMPDAIPEEYKLKEIWT